MKVIGNIWKPEVFQGKGKKSGYFEGWYFKAVDQAEQAAYAIIPGISLANDPAKSHAFVMLLDARKHRLLYSRYPIESFRPRERPFGLEIGGNYFSMRELRLDMADGPTQVKAWLQFDNIHPWPVRPWSPGVMGWYAFVPGMECYHGVLSLNHRLSGYIEVGGKRVEMDGGKGYNEKDWGRSMPSAWIWMQTNHFDEDGVSLTGSIAKIPWRGRFFTGHIFGLCCNGHLYRFTTYTGAKISRLEVDDSTVEIALEDRHYRLEIRAERAAGVNLPAPELGEMTARVNESLNSSIFIRLSQKSKAGLETVFAGTGRSAGLEVLGDMGELLSGIARNR